MARHEVIRICGHKEVAETPKSMYSRGSWQKQQEALPCSDCAPEYERKAREAAAIKLKQSLSAIGISQDLPDLEGSVKQIAFAEKVRKEMVPKVLERGERYAQFLPAYAEVFSETVVNTVMQTDSAFWLDLRHSREIVRPFAEAMLEHDGLDAFIKALLVLNPRRVEDREIRRLKQIAEEYRSSGDIPNIHDLITEMFFFIEKMQMREEAFLRNGFHDDDE